MEAVASPVLKGNLEGTFCMKKIFTIQFKYSNSQNL